MNISKATGYHHGRRLQRMTQSTSIRNTNMTEVGLGLSAFIGLLIPVIIVVMIFGLG